MCLNENEERIVSFKTPLRSLPQEIARLEVAEVLIKRLLGLMAMGSVSEAVAL